MDFVFCPPIYVPIGNFHNEEWTDQSQEGNLHNFCYTRKHSFSFHSGITNKTRTQRFIIRFLTLYMLYICIQCTSLLIDVVILFVVQAGHHCARYVVYLVKLTSREKVSSLSIYISGDIGLFTVSKLTNCGKFKYWIDIINKTYSYMKSAITLWIKHAHLIVLQLSNSGLSVEFIASNNLISSHTFSLLIVPLRSDFDLIVAVTWLDQLWVDYVPKWFGLTSQPEMCVTRSELTNHKTKLLNMIYDTLHAIYLHAKC